MNKNFKTNNPKWRRDISTDAIIKLYTSNKMSCQDISKKLNCSLFLVQSRLKKSGVILRSASEAHKLKPARYWLGKKLPLEMINKTIETRRIRDTMDIEKRRNRKPRDSYIGEKNQFYGKTHSEETRRVIREKRALQVFPIRDTQIEVRIQNFLKELRMEFYTHHAISDINHCYACDIFIPSMNLIIECDGNYWHGNPQFFKEEDLNEFQREQRERDNYREKELKERGYLLLRMWENEILKMTLEEFGDKLNSIIKTVKTEARLQ